MAQEEATAGQGVLRRVALGEVDTLVKGVEGTVLAAERSNPVTVPHAMLLWTMAAYASRSSGHSALYRAVPVTFARPSSRLMGAPIMPGPLRARARG